MSEKSATNVQWISQLAIEHEYDRFLNIHKHVAVNQQHILHSLQITEENSKCTSEEAAIFDTKHHRSLRSKKTTETYFTVRK